MTATWRKVSDRMGLGLPLRGRVTGRISSTTQKDLSVWFIVLPLVTDFTVLKGISHLQNYPVSPQSPILGPHHHPKVCHVLHYNHPTVFDLPSSLSYQHPFLDIWNAASHRTRAQNVLLAPFMVSTETSAHPSLYSSQSITLHPS